MQHNQIINTYYNRICEQWGVNPTQISETGYEAHYTALAKLSKELWEAADELGKTQIEDEVFKIYRSVNVVPITYYSLDGCVEQLMRLASGYKNVEDASIGLGNNEGQSFCRFWFENMQEAYTRSDTEVSLRARFNNDHKLKKAINLCYKHRDNGEKSVFPMYIRTAFDLVGGGTIQNFKPMNARAIWEYLCPTMFGRVLDFSSGYGGRMLSAMTSRLRYNYTGIDPNTKTYNGLVALGELLNECGVGSGYQMNCVPSELYVPDPNSFDAAFSSPPYFNLETYCAEETQCMNNYSNLEAWFEKYVEPTLKMIHVGLQPGALYAVNIADYNFGKERYNIVE